LFLKIESITIHKKISYTQISKDSLVTEISGMQSGKLSSEKYIMLKTKHLLHIIETASLEYSGAVL
jgi:hypothetical protein